MRKILKKDGVQTLLASLICIVLGLLIGYIVLLCINPKGASDAIMEIIKNFFHYSSSKLQIKNFGNTLVKTAPLVMCSLSVLFCYKVGLFNIGAAGQYVAGSCAAIYAALGWGWNWIFCMLFAMIIAALDGVIVGIFKAYFNVNEVISGIMLNWIALYVSNMVLTRVKEQASPYTFHIRSSAEQALLPQVGLNKFFPNNNYVSLAIPLSVFFAVVIWLVLEKTKFGYELKATGLNKNAAKYCGMAEKRNIIVTLAIGGGLAGLSAAFFYLTDYEQWLCTASSVPAMGFNGIAAAFLGGLNPIGAVFSSYFIQHITSGGAFVDKTYYCAQISDLIASIIIYLCGFVFFMKYAMTNFVNHSEKAKVSNGNNAKGGES